MIVIYSAKIPVTEMCYKPSKIVKVFTNALAHGQILSNSV
jgi:hypothetical protein